MLFPGTAACLFFYCRSRHINQKISLSDPLPLFPASLGSPHFADESFRRRLWSISFDRLWLKSCFDLIGRVVESHTLVRVYQKAWARILPEYLSFFVVQGVGIRYSRAAMQLNKHCLLAVMGIFCCVLATFILI